jgi:membrane associated rhomboid family serine protease
MQASNFFLRPHKTPASIKWLIWITCCVTLISPILTYFFASTWQLPGPSAWLGLSLDGLKHGWLWQPLTYFFLHTAGIGISFSLLISLFFHMFLLWFAGSEIALRFGNRQLLFFYLGGGVAAGVVAAALMYAFSSNSVLVGSTPAVYALITLWSMMFPELELFFFFFIRIKAKWLVLLFLGLSLLSDLSYGDFISFFADCVGIAWGFLIGHFVWKLKNPFPLNLDLPSKKKRPGKGHIIDITAFHESDEDFMDRMLEKIANKGENSLSPREKSRMDSISKKKR